MHCNIIIFQHCVYNISTFLPHVSTLSCLFLQLFVQYEKCLWSLNVANFTGERENERALPSTAEHCRALGLSIRGYTFGSFTY